MDQAEAARILTSCRNDLHRFGVTGLYLFGSTARGEAGPQSDVDLFVDYDPERFGFVELIRLEKLLSDALGRKADLTTREGLHPVLRSDIERSAMKVV